MMPLQSQRAALFVLLALLPTGSASAQTVVGRVLDEARLSPVPGAVVRLLDESHERRAEVIADPSGAFTLEPPGAGRYFLGATALGYADGLSPLLEFTAEGSIRLDFTLTPLPVGIGGLEVTVEAAASSLLAPLGLSPETLGSRWIDRAFIESVAVKRDLGTILEWKTVSGASIIRPENQVPGSDNMGLCVSLSRARTGGGMGRCALIVLDGTPISGPNALSVDPDGIEAMAILMPGEATQLWGLRGSPGALLLWTRQGRPR